MTGHGESSELGSRDIDGLSREAEMNGSATPESRDCGTKAGANESIPVAGGQPGRAEGHVGNVTGDW